MFNFQCSLFGHDEHEEAQRTQRFADSSFVAVVVRRVLRAPLHL